MKKKLIIYGLGPHAEMTYSYFSYDSNYEVVAFTVEKAYLIKKELFNLPVIAYEDINQHFLPEQVEMFIAIGPHSLNQVRERFYHDAKVRGYKLASYYSSKANMWNDFKYGDNCLIDNCSKSHPFVEIGNNVVLIDSDIGHHSIIGNNSFVSSTIIGGNVIVEDNVFIGIGSFVNSGVRIGKGSIISMGCVITNDVEPYSVYSSSSTKKRNIDSRRVKLY